MNKYPGVHAYTQKVKSAIMVVHNGLIAAQVKHT